MCGTDGRAKLCHQGPNCASPYSPGCLYGLVTPLDQALRGQAERNRGRGQARQGTYGDRCPGDPYFQAPYTPEGLLHTSKGLFSPCLPRWVSHIYWVSSGKGKSRQRRTSQLIGEADCCFHCWLLTDCWWSLCCLAGSHTYAHTHTRKTMHYKIIKQVFPSL